MFSGKIYRGQSHTLLLLFFKLEKGFHAKYCKRKNNFIGTGQIMGNLSLTFHYALFLMWAKFTIYVCK